jgi:hypothetical protein
MVGVEKDELAVKWRGWVSSRVERAIIFALVCRHTNTCPPPPLSPHDNCDDHDDDNNYFHFHNRSFSPPRCLSQVNHRLAG